MAQQFINEENLGSEGTEEMARLVVAELLRMGWNIEYGNSMMSEPLNDEWQGIFEDEFYAALNVVITGE